MFKSKTYHQKNETIDANLKWLLSNPGQDFFTDSEWQFGQRCSSLTVEPDSLNPLALVGRYFREDRLRRALTIAVCPGQASGAVADALVLTKEAEESNQAVDVGVLAPCQDSRSRWWAAAVAASSHWIRGEKDEAVKLYNAVESYPVLE